METPATGVGAPRLMATCGGNDADEKKIVSIHSGDSNTK